MPTVLLVENDLVLLRGLLDALEHSGFTVLSADSGESAIRVCKETPGRIDVLVSDVQLRRLSGFEVAAFVKSVHPDVNVILMSGLPTETFPQQAMADQFLKKPFVLDQLLAAISRHATIPADEGGARES